MRLRCSQRLKAATALGPGSPSNVGDHNLGALLAKSRAVGLPHSVRSACDDCDLPSRRMRPSLVPALYMADRRGETGTDHYEPFSIIAVWVPYSMDRGASPQRQRSGAQGEPLVSAECDASADRTVAGHAAGVWHEYPRLAGMLAAQIQECLA